MFWNLVAVQYEKYKLHHVLLFGLLLVYSILGAVIFCGIEGPAAQLRVDEKAKEGVRRSVAAKKVLVDTIQKMYFANTNNSEFYEIQLRKALDHYDIRMDMKPKRQPVKWDLWSGLYYAGTIYTTIGYGDVAAKTTWGRVFTMFYAFIGIPMVITLLNDWGTLMFCAVDSVWKNHARNCFQQFTRYLKSLQKKENSKEDLERLYSFQEECADPDEEEPIPLFLVLIVLLFWVILCTVVFAFLENWSFFHSMYFFFISLTTIGFGDVTPSPRVAVANFLLILIGLSVVSMSINVVQMQLEIIFARIVKSIDNDFKKNLSISAEENKKTASTGDQGDTERSKSTVGPDGNDDVIKQYGQNMNGADKLIMHFMSNHQRKMLNEKFEERSKMRNKWTQTMTQIKVASVQTADKYDDLLNFPDEEEEEEVKPKSRINAKRLYIYNTGE